MPAHRDDATLNSGVAYKQFAWRSACIHRGLHAGNESRLAIERIGGRRLDIPTHAQIDRQSRINPEIVLREKSRGPTVRVANDRRVLLNGAWQAQQKVRQRVPGAIRTAKRKGAPIA